MKTISLFLMLLLAGQVFANCEGPELENIQFTNSEYRMLEKIQQNESLLDSAATLMTWSPLLVLAEEIGLMSTFQSQQPIGLNYKPPISAYRNGE
jgi:hypothetical protein